MADETACPAPLSTTLIHGDCLEVMPQLPAQSVHMVFADLPYSVTSAKWDVAIDLPSFWDNVRRLSAGPAVTVGTGVQPYTSDFIASNRKNFRQELIWSRKSVTGFYSAKRRVLNAHENVVVFGASNSTYNPQLSEGKVLTNTGSRTGGDLHGGARRYKPRKSSFRYPKSVLTVEEPDLRHDTLNGHVTQRVHPTQKPVALLEWLIRTYSKIGDTILDPCAGSGTTAIAALRAGGGRKAICIEKDAGYFEVARKRVDAERAAMGLPPSDCR